MNVQLPIGLSDLGSFDAQEKGTTREMANVDPYDALTLRAQPSQRAGQSRHTSAFLSSGNKVALIGDVVYDVQQVTYTSLGSSVQTVWNVTTPTISDAFGNLTDSLGNRYVLDGLTGIVKYSADGQQVWKLSLPALEPGSVVRALAVSDVGRIYAGVSEGDASKARLWCYDQIEENKTRLLWEETPGWCTEWLVIRGSEMYACQNDATRHLSRMAVYVNIGLPNPTIVREWEVPYPVNCHDVSVLDGKIVTAHEPLSTRGILPGSPDTTARSIDWTWEKIDHFEQRAWAHLDATDIDGDGSNNAEYENGDVPEVWVDKRGNLRNMVGRGSDTIGTVQKEAWAGRDVLFMNGSSNSMVSADGVSTDPTFRAVNRTLLPCHKGAQFVAWFLCRTPPGETTDTVTVANNSRRWVMGVHKSTTSTDARCLFTNIDCSDNPANTPRYGNAALYEDTSTAASADRAQGSNDQPLTGPFNDDGYILFAWVHDGGVDDDASTPTRSSIWVNGRPLDRWHSRADYETLEATFIGWLETTAGARFEQTANTVGRFLGQVAEVRVLADWYLNSAGFTGVSTRQRLVTMPQYPDVSFSINGDSEFERITGEIAHKWGIAHKLPSGQFNALACTANPASGETVTIASTVYTFRTALTPVAYEVLRGSDTFGSLRNLCKAINGGGIAGTDYATGTAPHPTFVCIGVVDEGGTGLDPTLIIQSRDGNAAAAATTETLGSGSWVSGATTVTSRNSPTDAQGGVNTGHYPHTFFLYPTAQSAGGPPREDGPTAASVAGSLTSPYAITAKWDPANGRVVWVLTSNGAGASGVGVGGHGYWVGVNSRGDVYTKGPPQAAVSGVFAVSNMGARKVIDLGETFNLTNGAGDADAWSWQFTTQDYHYPRGAIDKFDNVYLPISDSSGAANYLVAFQRLGSGPAANNATAILSLSDPVDQPKAYSVAVDPEYPDYPSSFTDMRAERITVAAKKRTVSNTSAVYDLRLVDAVALNVAPRASVQWAVCNGGLYTFSAGGAPSLVEASFLASGARFVDACTIFGRVFAVDGVITREYNPKTNVVSYLRARSAGRIPPRPRLITAWRKRLVLAGFADNPHSFAMSAYDDPYGWDFDPQGDSPVTIAAIRSTLSTMGEFPDQVQGLAPKRDDLLVILGARSVYVARGDPGQGGELDQVHRGIGAAFGRAWCWLPNDTFFWMTNQAELYSLSSVGSLSPVSRSIQRRLQNAIDFSSFRVELHYSPAERCIYVLQVPNGAGNTLATHFKYSLDTELFTELSYGATGVQPTSAALVDGDTAGARRFLLGGRDGWVRYVDPTAKDDDGTRIASSMIVPLSVGASGVEAMLKRLEVILARDQGGARVELLSSTHPDELGDPVYVTDLEAGWNTPDARVAGAWLYARITGAMSPAQRWSIVRMAAEVSDIGRQRPRVNG